LTRLPAFFPNALPAASSRLAHQLFGDTADKEAVYATAPWLPATLHPPRALLEAAPKGALHFVRSTSCGAHGQSFYGHASMKANECGASSTALPKVAIRRGFQADDFLIG